ncbi:DUF2867 domain-containing protein [Thiomonas delicata]|jgi:hypothetical protein|nr:DUF2867 domain-containing protein [Thiomonas delicata]
MNEGPRETTAPPSSLVAGLLVGSDFHDSWSVESNAVELPALDHFIAAIGHTPKWVNACMALRNRTASLLGLKDLGHLSALIPGKSPSEYRLGDRVGIFTLFENTFDEALLGDKDKHLNVILSVHRALLPGEPKVLITVTTVVHVHNSLGRIYMLPVKPMHRVIVPAVLDAIGNRMNRGSGTQWEREVS